MDAPKIFPLSAAVLEQSISNVVRSDIDEFMAVFAEVNRRVMEIVNTDLLGDEQDKEEIQRLLKGNEHFVRKMQLRVLEKPQQIRAHCVPLPDGN